MRKDKKEKEEGTNDKKDGEGKEKEKDTRGK